jgi:hypothetical protein
MKAAATAGRGQKHSQRRKNGAIDPQQKKK